MQAAMPMPMPMPMPTPMPIPMPMPTPMPVPVLMLAVVRHLMAIWIGGQSRIWIEDDVASEFLVVAKIILGARIYLWSVVYIRASIA